MRNFLKFAFLCALLLFSSAPAYAQADIHVFFVGNANQFASNAPANLFSGAAGEVYIFSPGPSVAVTFYISNTSASTYSLTYQVFATGNAVVSNYSSNTLYWSQVQTWNSLGSYSIGTAVTVTVPASGTLSIYVGQSNGAQVALALTNSTGTSAQLQNLSVVLASNGVLPVSAVQGTGPQGSPPVGNPVYVGGQVQSSVAQNKLEPLPIVASSGGTDFGMNEGARCGTVCQASSIRLFGFSGQDVFGIEAFGYQFSTSDHLEQGAVQSPTSGGSIVGDSLFTTDGGAQFSVSATITTNTTQNLAGVGSGDHPGCTFLLKTTSGVTGTSPTLNVFIQDSNDTTTWNDRVSFSQMTASANLTQIAAVSSGSINPVVPVTASLTAGSIVNGNLGPFLRAQFVVGGTSPSFPIQVIANCQ